MSYNTWIMRRVDNRQHNTHRKCQDYVYVNGKYKSTMQKTKHYLRQENKVIENNVLSYCETLSLC